jgi:hypothetical protein
MGQPSGHGKSGADHRASGHDLGRKGVRIFRAFSSEVDTGSREKKRVKTRI